MHYLILSLLSLVAASTWAQSVGINATGSAPNSSAMLDIKSSNKGLLIPRVDLSSETDISTIPSPALYLLIFNTNSSLPNGQGFYFWNGSQWAKLPSVANLNSFSWGTSGNSGTNPSTNFIGTTDGNPIVFKVNSNFCGKIEPGNNNVFLGRGAGEFTSGVNNSFFGHQAGSENSSGIQNTGIGAFALDSNTTGSNNTAVGLSALRANTTGIENTAIGSRALLSNKTGSGNISVGRQSLLNSVDATDCIVIGNNALSSIATAAGTIAIGSGAMQNAANGTRSIGVGFNALMSNNGINNTAFGYESLQNNSDGGSNVGIGTYSLFANTTGTDNIAIGFSAAENNTSGYQNTAIGSNSFLSNTTGHENTALGDAAMFGNTGGSSNTGIGKNALFNNTTGNNNTALGTDAFAASGTLSNATMIGYQASASTSNTMTFGNSFVDRWAFGISTTNANHALEVGSNSGNGNGAYLTQGGTWTNSSTRNKKEEFTDVDGDDLVRKLTTLQIQKWKYKGTNEYHIGPVAEDFYKLFGLGEDDKGISTIDPAGIALAAIQQLARENNLLRQEIEELKKTVQSIKEGH